MKQSANCCTIQTIRSGTGPPRKRSRHSIVGQVLDHYTDRYVDDLVEPVGMLLAPIFFVLTGMHVSLTGLLDGSVLLLALGLTVVAFVGKIATGLVAGNVNRWLVGWGCFRGVRLV